MCAEDVEPKLLGMPSLIPSIPSSNPLPETFLCREESFRGSGKLESGPASPCKCSQLLRLFILLMLLVNMDGGGGNDMSLLRLEWKEDSVGEEGGEVIIPGGSGRGPRRTIDSKL